MKLGHLANFLLSDFAIANQFWDDSDLSWNNQFTILKFKIWDLKANFHLWFNGDGNLSRISIDGYYAWHEIASTNLKCKTTANDFKLQIKQILTACGIE